MSRRPGAIIVGATAMFGAKVNCSPFLRRGSTCSGDQSGRLRTKGGPEMRKMIRSVLPAAAACALLAGCAQPTPVQPLPPGPTPAEVADYARAQAQYRSGLASGNDNLVTKATDTFSLTAQEVLSRQDPRLFDAQVVCERYRVAGPHDRRDMQTTYEPQFGQDCRRIDWRYDQATIAIRRDLEARITAAERATIAQAGAGYP